MIVAALLAVVMEDSKPFEANGKPRDFAQRIEEARARQAEDSALTKGASLRETPDDWYDERRFAAQIDDSESEDDLPSQFKPWIPRPQPSQLENVMADPPLPSERDSQQTAQSLP